jgi:hypothetical protein
VGSGVVEDEGAGDSVCVDDVEDEIEDVEGTLA